MSETVGADLLVPFFRASIAFYNAKPWKLVHTDERLRVQVDSEQALYACINGSDAAARPGMILHSVHAPIPDSPFGEDTPETARLKLAFDGALIVLEYVHEQDAPEWLRDAQRRLRLPVASPTAFPSCFAISQSSGKRELHPDELDALAIAVNAMSAYFATKRKQIQSREPHADLIAVRDRRNVELCHCAISLRSPRANRMATSQDQTR